MIFGTAEKLEKGAWVMHFRNSVGEVPGTGTFRRVNPPRGRVMIPTGTHLRRRSACSPANYNYITNV